jgi:flagellar basal body-associated protein FliL
MIMMKAKRVLLIVLLVLFFVFEASSQCSMCRAVLESEADQGAAEAINDGIVYLMAFPYILVGGVLYVIYRTFKNKKSQQNS